MSQLEVDKIIPQSGTTLTIGDSGDTINFADGQNINIDSNTLYIDSTNNRVGIGTNSPGRKLTLYDATNSFFALQNSTSGTGSSDGFQLQIFSDDAYVWNYESAGDMYFGTSGEYRQKIASNGDISFYEDTGTTPKFFWDASGEKLGIGQSNPTMGQINLATTGNFTTAFTDSTATCISMYSTGTAGDGNYGAGIAWGALGGVNSHQAAISSVQTGSDANQVGLAFFTHNSTVGSDPMIERMRIDSSGNLLLDKTTTSNTTAGVRLGVGGVVAPSRTADAPIVASRLSNNGRIIELRKDSTLIGEIGCNSGTNLIIGTSSTGIYFNSGGNAVHPWNISTNSTRNNEIDLGRSVDKFKDLYLGGGLYVGGTGTANKLDDYEEGTITIAGGSYLFNGSGSINFDSSFNELSYTKIGSMVSLQGRLIIDTITGTPSGTYIYMTGALPFTPADLTDHSGRAAVNIGLSNATIGTPQAAAGMISENSTTLYIYLRTASGSQVSNMANGTIYINVTYRTN
jgi:hypothetical protein